MKRPDSMPMRQRGEWGGGEGEKDILYAHESEGRAGGGESEKARLCAHEEEGRVEWRRD